MLKPLDASKFPLRLLINIIDAKLSKLLTPVHAARSQTIAIPFYLQGLTSSSSSSHLRRWRIPSPSSPELPQALSCSSSEPSLIHHCLQPTTGRFLALMRSHHAQSHLYLPHLQSLRFPDASSSRIRRESPLHHLRPCPVREPDKAVSSPPGSKTSKTSS